MSSPTRGHDADQDSIDVLSPMFPDPADQVAARELAEAERAVAAQAGTPGQQAGAAAAGHHRTPEDRVDAWQATKDQTDDGDRPDG